MPSPRRRVRGAALVAALATFALAPGPRAQALPDDLSLDALLAAVDASPGVRAKLASADDAAGAAIIDRILRDEIGHVAIGNRWYRWLCARRGLDPLATYTELAARHGAPRLRAPFNLVARRAAGFSDEELAQLG